MASPNAESAVLPSPELLHCGDSSAGRTRVRGRTLLFALALGLIALAAPAPARDSVAFAVTREPTSRVVVARHAPDAGLAGAESTLSTGTAPGLRALKEPLQASSGAPTWIWAALLMAGFVGVTALTMALARIPTRRPPPPLVALADEAPDEAARRELDAIAATSLLEREEVVEHYRRLDACLRAYLWRRFDIPALAMTPQELEARLSELKVDAPAIRLAVSLLEQCQAVQSAGQRPARERAEADLSSAYEVVRLTATPQPEPETSASS